MSGHTPGPWAYSTSDEGWTFSIYQADDAGFTPESSDVATLFARTVQCDPKDTQEANARLIAASPKLLACAKRSAAALRAAGIEPAAYSDNPLEELLSLTEAAIEAATGEPK